MGTHPLQGDNRELTMVERVPEEGSGRPQCQPARTKGLKENAHGGRGFGSPKKMFRRECKRSKEKQKLKESKGLSW